MNTFSDWINAELDTRQWSQADLHRKSGMSRTVISNVVSGTSVPGWDFCVGIAKAFNLQPTEVFRRAGLLPSINVQDEVRERLLYRFALLSEADKTHLMNYIDFLLSKQG